MDCGMTDFLKRQIWRKLGALPEEKQHEVLDFIEFLSSDFSDGSTPSTPMLHQFAETVQKGLRQRGVSASTMKGTMKVLGAAERVFEPFREARREFLAELEAAPPEPPHDRDHEPPEEREVIVE